MNYAQLPSPHQPDTEIVMPEGQSIGGYSVGIIVINVNYPLMPGNVANASTYSFPVLIRVLEEATVDMILAGDPRLEAMIIEAGHELSQKGVRAIVGACGAFANYQKAAVEAFRVPTYMSILTQLPFILQSIRADQKVGVVAASESSLTPHILEECGIQEPERLLVLGAQDLPEFQKLLKCTGRFNSHTLEGELLDLVRDFVEAHPELGALVIQCSDLPPYSWTIQNAVQLPVYDMPMLIEWLHRCVVRVPFQGYI